MSGIAGVGIIGAGVISTQYLENLTQYPDVEVRFVADIDLDRAHDRAQTYGVAGSGTVDELLSRDDIEIVVNLTIPAAHAEVGARILDAGKHVFGEKPLALSRAEGRELLDRAAGLGLRVASAPDTVLGPGLQSARRAIEDGAIGTPLTGLALFQTPGPDAWHPNPDFLFAPGGGPLFDMGPYYLTALVQVLGPVVRVSASASTARTERIIGSGPRAGEAVPVLVPTHVGALLEFEGGGSAQTVFSFDSPLVRAGAIEIGGAEGVAVLPDPNRFEGDTVVWSRGDAEPRTLPAVGAAAGRGIGVVDLARAIRGGTAERASGELAFHVLDVMIAIAESASGGAPTDVASSASIAAPLPADWDPRARTL